jgi:hypothetical protein
LAKHPVITMMLPGWLWTLVRIKRESSLAQKTIFSHDVYRALVVLAQGLCYFTLDGQFILACPILFKTHATIIPFIALCCVVIRALVKDSGLNPIFIPFYISPINTFFYFVIKNELWATIIYITVYLADNVWMYDCHICKCFISTRLLYSSLTKQDTVLSLSSVGSFLDRTNQF